MRSTTRIFAAFLAVLVAIVPTFAADIPGSLGYVNGPGGYYLKSDGSGPYTISSAGVASLIGQISGATINSVAGPTVSEVTLIDKTTGAVVIRRTTIAANGNVTVGFFDVSGNAVSPSPANLVPPSGGGTTQPVTLGTLALASNSAVAGTAFSTAISGISSGSSISASSSDGATLTVSGGVLSGTFATSGTKNLVLTETLGGATNSPKMTNLIVTVAAQAPTLGMLSLNTTTATAGSTFTASITGQTAGSSLSATSSDGTAVSVSGATLTATFSTAGSPTLAIVETLANASGSPRTTNVGITVNPAPKVLQTLALANPSAVAGSAYSSVISNVTSGSTITATSSDGTSLSVTGGNTLSGTFTAAGSPTISLVETLSGATGSPKTSTATVTVSAQPPTTTGLTATLVDPTFTAVVLH